MPKRPLLGPFLAQWFMQIIFINTFKGQIMHFCHGTGYVVNTRFLAHFYSDLMHRLYSDIRANKWQLKPLVWGDVRQIHKICENRQIHQNPKCKYLYYQISRGAVANPANCRPNTRKGSHNGTLLDVLSVFSALFPILLSPILTSSSLTG